MKIAAAILIVACVGSYAEDAAKTVLLKLGELERKQRIAVLKKEKTTVYTAETVADEIRRLESAKGEYFPTLKMEEDSIGVFRNMGHKGGDHIAILQVIDESTMIIKTRAGLVWVDGYATKNLVDDKEMLMKGVFEYIGTKQYTAGLGASNTIYRIKKINFKEE